MPGRAILLEVNLWAAIDPIDEEPSLTSPLRLDGMSRLHSDDRESSPSPKEWYEWRKRFGVLVEEAKALLGPPHVDSEQDGHDLEWDSDLVRYAVWLRERDWIYVGLYLRAGPFDWAIGIEVGRVPERASWA